MKSSVSVTHTHTHTHTQTVTEATRHGTGQTTLHQVPSKSHYQSHRCVATAAPALAAGTAGKLRPWRCGRDTNAAAAASRRGSARIGTASVLTRLQPGRYERPQRHNLVWGARLTNAPSHYNRQCAGPILHPQKIKQ